MPKLLRIAVWFVALVVAAATLAVLGLRSMSAEASRVEERLRAQSAALARTAVEAVDAAARELEPDGVERLALKVSSEGEWLDAPAAPRTSDSGPTLYQRSQIDELERAGDVETAQSKLESYAERADQPGIAAWALSSLAAIQLRLGETDLARATLARLVAEHPEVVDERGLRRALAARWTLAQLDGLPRDELKELYRELIEDHVHIEQAAVATLAQLVGDALRGVDPTAFDELRARDEERRFARLLRASWTRGISNWIASGAPNGRAWFELAADPLASPLAVEHALVRVQPTEDGFDAVALRGSALAREALERPEIAAWNELGFGASLVDTSGRAVAGGELELDADTVVAALPPPFREFSVRARNLDIEGARREARRKFWTLAALSALALAVAVGASWVGIRALDREARAAHQREQFVAAVTHELQAPLASIRLLAELLEQGGVSEAKVREFGARTVSEADRLSRLVSSVLEIARLDGGAKPRDREDLLVRQLALETLRQFEPLALERRLAVKLGPCDESLRVLANRDALGSALFELLTNASKYGARSDIEVAIEPRGESVVVAVLDRGPGVAERDSERIFAPFQRLGDELTREQPGVGLGLALVRRVAEGHGGTARVVAREGGGSRFEIELPRASEERA